MDKDTRKVLDLLEFVIEMRGPDMGSVYNTFVLFVAQQEEDLEWVNDDEWAAWFQDYADKLIKEAKDV
ncbi:hypothetical protein LCGC14_3168140 [marine sediment metagenome]|uniref:Uncharacterized protein n=1 Tax=marine sediment metagenome TaxID=412755 RepID=A0A0F8VGV1_9ZZZZ